jgi:ribosomal protein S19E (S16A)
MADSIRMNDLSRNEWDWLRHIHDGRARMIPEDIQVRLQSMGLIQTDSNGFRTTMAGRNLLEAKDERLRQDTKP